MQRKTFLIFLLTILIGLIPDQPASACSGGVPRIPLDKLLKTDGMIFVRGHAGGRASGANGYILAEEYLVGTPRTPIMRIAMLGEGYIAASSMGYYSGYCEAFWGIPQDGRLTIFAVTQQYDGTFRLHGVFNFDDPDHLPLLGRTAPDGIHYFDQQLSEAEFLDTIDANPRPAEKYDSDSVIPSSILQPVLIRDEENNVYILPIDAYVSPDLVQIASNVHTVEAIDSYLALTTDTELILHERWSGTEWHWPIPQGVDCHEMACIQFTANAVLMAVQTGPDTIHLCDLALIYPNMTESDNYPSPCRDHENVRFNGTGFSISPDNATLAVWQPDGIAVYDGLDDASNTIWSGYRAVASTTINTNHPVQEPAWFLGKGVWSQDNRWLAYSDALGLWLWDVYTQEPRLYMATENAIVPQARYFSASSRYLAVTRGDLHTIHDLASNLVFADGVIGPFERFLLRADTVDGKPVPAEQCSLFDGSCTLLCPRIAEPALQTLTVKWDIHRIYPKRWTIQSVTCSDNVCHYRDCRPSDEPVNIRAKIYGDLGYQNIELTGDYVLQTALGITIDLEDQLVAPIRSIEWLPLPWV